MSGEGGGRALNMLKSQVPSFQRGSENFSPGWRAMACGAVGTQMSMSVEISRRIGPDARDTRAAEARTRQFHGVAGLAEDSGAHEAGSGHESGLAGDDAEGLRVRGSVSFRNSEGEQQI